MKNLLAAPRADEEEHRDERRLEEEVEEQQVERDEDADHRRLQNEHRGEEGEAALLDGVPARQNRDGDEQRRQQHEPEAHAVHADVVVGADAPDPERLLLEAERVGRPLADAARQEQQRDEEGQDREGERDQAVVLRARVRGESVQRDREGADRGQQDQDREQVVLHDVLL